MNELIKITKNDVGEKLVSARELWEFLNKPYNRFNMWFDKMKEYGFEKDVDFTSFAEKNANPVGGRPTIDYILKIDMAKELSMLARSEKGKQARRYFIECEKQLKSITPSYIIEDPIERAKAWIKEQEEKKALEYDNSVKTQLIAEYEPKVTYYDTILSDSSSLLNITQIAKDYGLSGKALNSILKDERVQYKQRGQWLLYSNHVNKGYTKSVTKEVNGIPRIMTKWKQKGRIFIHNILEERGIFANIDKRTRPIKSRQN